MHNNESDGGPGAAMTKDERVAADQILALLTRLPGDGSERVLAHLQDQLDERDLPMFSRGRPSGPLGKLDTPIKTWLDEGTAELFRRKAAMRHQDASAALRDCAYAWVHEKTYSLMVAEKALHDANAMDIREQMAGPFAGREFGAGARQG